ncbi:MAG: (deoxy)nucleoside triphosphate pyrophosphohydrolase [Spirochaetales bacterium]
MAKRSIAGIAAQKGKILVAKRKEGGAIGLCWEFPGGKVEEGERDEDALRREFEEELGILIVPLRLIGCSRFLSPSGERDLAAWLVAIPDSGALELREHSHAAWIAIDKLETLDLAGSDRALVPLLEREYRARPQDFE